MPATDLHFGRPCLASGGPIPGYPVLTGWSLGGLSDRDRARCAAFVRQYPATGDTGRWHGPVSSTRAIALARFVRCSPASAIACRADTGTDYRPTRASLEDAAQLLPCDRPQLWAAADLVRVAARKA